MALSLIELLFLFLTKAVPFGRMIRLSTLAELSMLCNVSAMLEEISTQLKAA
jgi:hypothetical protein